MPLVRMLKNRYDNSCCFFIFSVGMWGRKDKGTALGVGREERIMREWRKWMMEALGKGVRWTES